MSTIVVSMNTEKTVLNLRQRLEIKPGSKLNVSIVGDVTHGLLLCNLARHAIFNERHERVLAICDADTHLSVQAQEEKHSYISLSYESLGNGVSFKPITVFITIEPM